MGAAALSVVSSVAESSVGQVTQSGRQWNKGSYENSEESLKKHFEKHGDEVGAKDIQQFYNKADNFAKNLKGATKRNIEGFTEGVKRFYKNNKYIDLAPDGSIISFGCQ